MPTLFEELSNFFQTGPVSRVRRNHGLEHATLHVIAERFPGKAIGGHSDFRGFWIVGDLATEDLAEAVREALQRLNDGQHHLAVHPNCGTNFVTAGALAGSAAVMAMLGVGRRKRDFFERIPLAVTMATLALIAAQPLGLRFQEQFTTDGHPGGLQVTEISLKQQGKASVHRVSTRG